jgi:hypothetical protein
VVTLKVFGDESADESAKRVFALSAVFGTEEEWVPTVAEWVRLTGGVEFHANEFETEFVRDSDRSKHKKRLDEYKALVHVLVNSPLVGFTVALDLGSFRAFFHDDFEVGYYKCFTDILAILAPLMRRWNDYVASDPAGGGDYLKAKAELTFDRRQGQGTILTLYDTFTAQPEWRGTDLFNTKVSFDTRANPRIQIADLLAREAMKELDRVITGRSARPRGSKVALDSIPKKFNFIQRDRVYIEKWKLQQATMEAIEGINAEGYGKWLIETGRVQNGKPVDNMRNRAMYMAWLDNRKAILGQ